MNSSLAYQLGAWGITLAVEGSLMSLLALTIVLFVPRWSWLTGNRLARRQFVVRWVLLALGVNLLVHPLFWAVHLAVRPYTPTTLYLLELGVVMIETVFYRAGSRLLGVLGGNLRGWIVVLGLSFCLNLLSLSAGLYLF